MKRRHLLLGGAAAIAAAAVGVYAAEFLSEEEIAAAVRHRLRTLRLDQDGPHAFARDYIAALVAKRPTWFRIKYHVRHLFSSRPGILADAVSNDHRSRRGRLEDNLAMVYLLSSDFFWNHADESRIVRYVAMYDPIRACGNPFARPPPGEVTTG